MTTIHPMLNEELRQQDLGGGGGGGSISMYMCIVPMVLSCMVRIDFHVRLDLSLLYNP